MIKSWLGSFCILGQGAAREVNFEVVLTLCCTVPLCTIELRRMTATLIERWTFGIVEGMRILYPMRG